MRNATKPMKRMVKAQYPKPCTKLHTIKHEKLRTIKHQQPIIIDLTGEDDDTIVFDLTKSYDAIVIDLTRPILEVTTTVAMCTNKNNETRTTNASRNRFMLLIIISNFHLFFVLT
jgi:hypothetical protein